MLRCARGAPTTRGETVARSKHRMCYIPLKLPLDSARHALGSERGYSFPCLMPGETRWWNIPVQLALVGARSSRAAPGRGDSSRLNLH